MPIMRCETDEQILATFETMLALRPDLAQQSYLETVRRLMQEAAYELVAFWDNQVATAVAGFFISECLAWGKYLYVADLVTRGDARSAGQGKALVDWMQQTAKKAGCTQLHLDSGVQRHGAHRFYLRERFDITSYHFAKKLDEGYTV